jgi:hybrid cluster-associated redox disulfide protein
MDRYTKGFVVAALGYFFLAAVLGIWIGAAEPASWAKFAHVHFNLLGFMAMMIYGVGYFILPRFNGRTLRWSSWVPVHFYLANIGLIGMVATSPERPSTGFTLFAVLSVVSVAMFVVNLGATMLLAPAASEEVEGDEESPPEAARQEPPAGPPVDIHPDMRVGEILSHWPETVEVFVENGFASLANPEHREQVKQIPITLRMACQRHNVDLEPMVARLIAAASGEVAPAAATGSSTGARARKGGLASGDPIRPDNILGDILSVYPETMKVFRKYYGEGCFSCPGQATESVKQSAMMHNINEKQILAELNRAAGARTQPL